MKRSLAFFFLLMLPPALFAQEDTRPTISVFNFETSGLFQGEMRLLVDFLSSNIIETKKYKVIEREQRQAVLSEIEFSNSDCTDEKCQLEIGRMLSANQIVTGSVGKFGERYLITAKLIDVETAQSKNASSKVYSSLNDLLDDSKTLVLKLVEAETKPGEAQIAGLQAAGVQMIDEKPRDGAHGTRIAFLHPKSSGKILTELTQV